MNGELRTLRTDDYDPSYDINNLSNYDFEKLTLIKLEIESELHILAKRLEAVRINLHMEGARPYNTNLEKNKADMQTSLLSSDGFPRSDIDVVEVRTTRVKIIKLKNDLRSVMEEISSRLLSQFQTNAFCNTLEISQETPVPFAIITEVVSNSPAEFSGLKVQDKVVRFGDIDATNHNDLKNIAYLVKNKENVSTTIFNMAFFAFRDRDTNGIQKSSIDILILRELQQISISLTPSSDWPGQGLLGCRLNQIK